METESHPLITKSRLEALSDGVIAIVMTILVLQLGDSEIFDATSEAELHAALAAQWPLFVSYAVSFLVVGAYWVAHHTYFSFIHEVNEPFPESAFPRVLIPVARDPVSCDFP